MEKTFTENRTHKTPMGGVKSEIFYMDMDWNPTDKEEATMAMIHELDENGHLIAETIGFIVTSFREICL